MHDGIKEDQRKRPVRPGDLPAIAAPDSAVAEVPVGDVAADTSTLPPIGTDPVSPGVAPVIDPSAVASDAPVQADLPQIAGPANVASTTPSADPNAPTGTTGTTSTTSDGVDPISAQGLAMIGNDVKMATPRQDQLGQDTDTYRNLEQNNRMHRDPKTGQMVENTHSVWSRIAAAAMGWARGGLLGGIEAARNPHYFEDQRTDQDRRSMLPVIAADEKSAQIEQQGNAAKLRAAATIDTLKARAGAAKQRFQDRLSLLQTQNKEQKPWEAPDGKMYWVDKTGKKVAMTEKDGQGNDVQMTNPDKTYYDAVSPITNTPIRIRGSALETAEATMAAGNARNQNEADRTNMQAALEVNRRNADRANEWAKTTQAQVNQVIQAQGALAGQSPVLTNLQQQLGVIGSDINALDPKDPDIEKKRTAIMKRYDDAMKSVNATLGKTAQGQQIVQALQQNMPPRPTFEAKPTPLTPHTVTVKKGIIPYATVVEQAKKKGVNPEKAKKDAEDAGYIVQ